MSFKEDDNKISCLKLLTVNSIHASMIGETMLMKFMLIIFICVGLSSRSCII